MGRVKLDLDAKLGHVLHEDVDDVPVNEPQDDAPNYEGDFYAEGCQDLGKLDTDIAASDDDALFGQDLHLEETITIKAVLRAWEGTSFRHAPRGNQNVLSGEELVTDLDHLIRDE